MSQTVFPVSVGANVSLSFICLTGFIRRAEPIGVIQRGTHRLVDTNGRVIASLRSNQVNLFAVEGRFATVCGINEGQIEGITSILVTQVLGANIPGTVTPPAGQVDLNTVLLLLILNQLGVQIQPGVLNQFGISLGSTAFSSVGTGLGAI